MSIEAGRETDERIAVEVMGWEQRAWASPRAAGRLYYFAPDEPTPHAVPHYSTDRSAALEVVDRLIAAGMAVTLLLGGEEGTTSCVVWDGFDTLAEVGGHNPLPLAICAAALDPRVLAHLRSVSPGPRETSE